MGGDNKLAAKKTRRVFEKLQKFLLLRRRKAVLRLVQQIETVFFDFVRKIQKSAFAVGMLADIVHQIPADIF